MTDSISVENKAWSVFLTVTYISRPVSSHTYTWNAKDSKRLCSAVEFKRSGPYCDEDYIVYDGSIVKLSLCTDGRNAEQSWLFKNSRIRPHFNNKVGEYILICDDFVQLDIHGRSSGADWTDTNLGSKS